jgi:hypothetical protein
MSDLTQFERAVMHKLLDGEDEGLSILREQFEVVAVIKREMTGVGFYMTFSVPEGARHLRGKPSFKFGDVSANVAGLEWGAGFLLYVQDGALHMLEGYAYDESWPQQISVFDLSYTTGNRRDIEGLHRIFRGDKTR